ncbi:uncharacterized protein MONBRDRAFT_19306, partial [Monosiga brevicollis MX1]
MPPTCHSCGSSSVEEDESRGTTTCTVCGAIIEDNLIVSEVTFTEDRGVVERFVDADGRGAFNSGAYGGYRDSRQTTIANGRALIQQLANKMQMNSHHIDMAVNYYKQAVEHRFTQGRPKEHVVAACLYIVCRQQKTSHMLLDFSDQLRVNVYKLAATYMQLCNKLLTSLPVVDPVLYIPRFAHHMRFGELTHEVSKTALRIVSRMKRDWIHVGRRPSGVCGAALLLAARMHGFQRNLQDVQQAVHVGIQTVRARLEDFGNTESSKLTPEQFQTIELGGEAEPPAF